MKTAIIATSLVLLMISFFIILIIVLYTVRQRKNKLEKQQLQAQFSEVLLTSQLEIQEQTMQHISRELHDNLSHIASLIKINLNTLQFNDIEKAVEKTENTKELARQLIRDLKGLSVSLGSDHLSRAGIVKALELEVDRLNKTGEFNAIFNNETTHVIIPDDWAVIFYRMIQEVLNNCIKHAQAKHIIINLKNIENKYILVIADDGIGFKKDEITSLTSAGLKNLETRAHLINAKLLINSDPGKGTQVTIELPA